MIGVERRGWPLTHDPALHLHARIALHLL